MATNNAINTTFPINVASGGTGAASFTANSLLVGNGTSALGTVAVGATGTLLTGVTASNPAFATSLTGDFTFTSSTAASSRFLGVNHTNNANTASNAFIQISTGGASGGDPSQIYTVTGVTDWSMGIDNSVTSPGVDPFVIAASNALGTTNVMSIKTTGEMNLPLQPAFLGIIQSNDTNVTGDGTVYTLGTNVAFTEVFDQGTNFNTNGTFTAPVTGRYFLHMHIKMGGLGIAMTSAIVRIVTNSANYTGNTINPGVAMDVGSELGLQVTTIANMTAGHTATFVVQISGSTATADVIGSGTDAFSYVCGYLVA